MNRSATPTPATAATEAAPAAAEAAPVGASGGSDAFEEFRKAYGLKRLPQELVANEDQVKQMLETDGLLLWGPGEVDVGGGERPADPVITREMTVSKLLWVVEPTRVPYASEQCDFGKTLQTGVIKHSNLTGGGDAHCGGEMIKIDSHNIVVNGWSGRYGPKSEDEMTAVAKAFRASGYNVWSMGFDSEAARAFPFIGVSPVWVP